ncbi:MAG TPA: hypothetical protein VLU23_08235 [Pseudolabrys sp.]|nr:hypothetical protein [Pseudolabrys sp.]
MSNVGNPSIYNNATFLWTHTIEREWCAIRVELDRVLTRKDELLAFHELASDATSISQDNNWKSFLLAGYGFRLGIISSCTPTPGASAISRD